MKFSTKDRYALRLMVELANRAPDEFVPLKEISEHQDISLKYLEQIMTPLSRAGLVVSGRGSQGGYRLARLPVQYTAGEILRAIEGELVPIPCLENNAADCPRRGECYTLGFWSGLNDAINRYVDSVTLEDLRQQPLGADDYSI
ncbi:MAG: Rrf2 family transcriptional regulator [Gemmiger sp.]|nr:Rrf2 family transcriptional regulator [Gemmiger sp.]